MIHGRGRTLVIWVMFMDNNFNGILLGCMACMMEKGQLPHIPSDRLIMVMTFAFIIFLDFTFVALEARIVISISRFREINF